MNDLLRLTSDERVWLTAYCARQVEPYRKLVSATQLAVMRETLFETLAIHPGTRELVERLAAKAKYVEQSSALPVDDEAVDTHRVPQRKGK